MNLETFVANGQAAQAAADSVIEQVSKGPKRTRLICRVEVRNLLLEQAKKTRAHPFTRVKEDTLIELNEVVRQWCVLRVARLPSMGRTI